MHTYTVNLRMIYRRTLNIEYAIIRRSISNKDKIFLKSIDGRKKILNLKLCDKDYKPISGYN